MKPYPQKIIDFHVHLFPDRLFAAVRKYFSQGYGWDVLYNLNYRECVAYLNERDVEFIVFSNYAHREGVAERLNRWNHGVLDEIPGLYCFCAFHPADENALHLAEAALTHPRVLGFKLQLLVQNFYPHDKRLYPLYELVMKRKKRLLMHTGNGPVGNEFVGIKQFKLLLRDFPDLPVTIPHMGALEYREFMDLMEQHKELYLDTAFSFAPLLPGRWNLHLSYLERMKDRIIYGSDFPNLIFPREDEIHYLRGLNLSTLFYEKVFHSNGLALIERHRG